jgi:hypothetical protein
MARSIISRQQEHVPDVGTPGSTTSSGSRLGWRQQLLLRRAERQRESLRHLDGWWDAQHEQVRVRTLEGYLDYVIQTRPSLRLVIYATLV